MDEYERDFKGVWIAREVWLDKRLTALDKVILTEIDSLDKGEGCFASNAYIADFCQCSEAKVSKAVAKLAQCGYIIIGDFNGRSRILQSCIVKSTRQHSKKYKAASQNLQQINNSDYNSDYKNKRPQAGFEDLIISYTEREIAEAERAEVVDLLREWIKARKAKRAAMTDKAIELNLGKLRTCVKASGLSFADYLREVIRRGWATFYPLTYSPTVSNAAPTAGGSLDIEDAKRRAVEETPVFNQEGRQNGRKQRL